MGSRAPTVCLAGTHTLPAPVPSSRESLSVPALGQEVLGFPRAVLRPESPLGEKGPMMHEPVVDTYIVL